VAYGLGVGVVVLLLLLGQLFLAELDLLASTVFALYSSVFVFLSLLSLHLSPYAAPAARPSLGRGGRGWRALVLLALALAGSVGGEVRGPAGGVAGAGDLLPWLCFYALTGDLADLQAALVHLLFVHLFVVETIWLNLHLLLGLALALALLGLARMGGATLGGLSALAQRARGACFPSNRRIRLVAQFRRQARRKSSSLVRA
jgi:hypothetical protein